MDQYLSLLLYILKKSGLFGSITTTTTAMAKELKISQQSVSRKLIEMHTAQLIKKENLGNKLKVSLDDQGRQYLSQLHAAVHAVFHDTGLKGVAKKGLGEGRYYMSLAPYQKLFKEKIGFKPFPGTFNLKVDPEKAQFFLGNIKPSRIQGFNTKERSFGGLDCYKAKLFDTKIIIVKPHRSNHPDSLLELIAPFNIRKKFNIKENQEVVVEK